MGAILVPSHAVLDLGAPYDGLAVRQKSHCAIGNQSARGAKSRLLGLHFGEIEGQFTRKETLFVKVVPQPDQPYLYP